MIFLSLFSGIEAASVAWNPLGWKCVAVAEIEAFPSAVLKHHYPDVPNLGDITKITKAQIEALGHIDVVVGGFPCQDLSVAGKQKGLKNVDGSNTRSGLFYDAIRIVEWTNARFLLLENVPGMLSSNTGLDFAAVAGTLLGCEFPVPNKKWQNSGMAVSKRGLVEWATLDAQYFGVAQRRRRVFIIRDIGDWRSRAPILLESESLRGDTPPSRGERKEVTEIAGTLAANGGGLNRPAGNANELDFCVTAFTPSGFADYKEGVGTLKSSAGDLGGGSESLIAQWPAEGVGALNASFGSKQGLENQHINSGAPLFVPAYGLAENTIGRQPKNGGNGTGYSEELSYTLNSTGVHGVCIPTAFAFDSLSSNSMKSSNPNSGCNEVDISKTIDTSGLNPACNQGGNAVMHNMAVRRLTPTECERLQGFPDSFTKLNDKTPDDPRYKALGNSMAVPVMNWIGKRIQASAR